MKKPLLTLAAVLCAAAFLYAFMLPKMMINNEHHQLFVKNGDSLTFGKPLLILGSQKSTITLSSMDGFSRFISTEDGFAHLVSFTPAPVPNYDELDGYNVSGSFRRMNDTLYLKLESDYDKLFICRTSDSCVVDVLGKECEIAISAYTKKGAIAGFDFSSSRNSFSLVALPNGVSRSEIFSKEHNLNKLAWFNAFTITSDNKQLEYPSGDYFIIGANSFTKDF